MVIGDDGTNEMTTLLLVITPARRTRTDERQVCEERVSVVVPSTSEQSPEWRSKVEDMLAETEAAKGKRQ